MRKLKEVIITYSGPRFLYRQLSTILDVLLGSEIGEIVSHPLGG